MIHTSMPRTAIIKTFHPVDIFVILIGGFAGGEEFCNADSEVEGGYKLKVNKYKKWVGLYLSYMKARSGLDHRLVRLTKLILLYGVRLV